jgi:RND family efflux transporter MFP subunit
MVVRQAGSDRFSPVAFYPERQPCGPFLADAAERALYESRPLVVSEDGRLGIAYPVIRQGRLEAIAAFEWPQGPEGGTEGLLRAIQWGLPWIEVRLGGAVDPVRADAAADPVLRKVLEAGNYPDAARAAATELAHRFACDRVSVGAVDGQRVTLAAISNTAQFDVRLALPRALEESMVQAVRSRSTLAGTAIDAPGSSVCVVSGGTAFCFERQAAIDPATVQAMEAASALLAPGLALQHANAVPVHRRVERRLRSFATEWFGRDAGRRRHIAWGVVALLVFLLFVPVEFRAAGDAVVEGAVRRVMTAPYDGYVLSSHARAGDLVKKDAPIAAIDDRDLRLERVRWASQQAQYARQLQEAIAKHERGQMQIIQAQFSQAEAQVQLLDEQLRRAKVVAPFDGLIVSGDLSQSVGSAVRKGDTLFEVTPLSGYRVVVQVDETEIAAVAVGQKGTLLLAAITGQTFPITVTSVTPVARAKEGRNAFRVEASLEGASERLRPGMEGIAKIAAGRRSLAWIWTHRFTNWLRLKVWSVWP